jgi:hypothetical protein
MPKNNKINKRIFANITENGNQKGNCDDFLNIDQEFGLNESPLLKQIKEKYSEIVKNCANDIKVLSALEEIIIQLRDKEIINSELRLSLSREYIYARSVFYRKENQINDIRVVVGKVEEYGSDLNQLITDTNFRIICISKLQEAMDKEILNNIANMNYIFNFEYEVK